MFGLAVLEVFCRTGILDPNDQPFQPQSDEAFADIFYPSEKPRQSLLRVTLGYPSRESE